MLLLGDDRRAAVTTLLRRLRSDDYLAVVRAYFGGFFAAADDPERRRWILDEIGRVPRHVGISLWEDATFHFDDAGAVSACRAPFLYIDAGTPNVDLDRLRHLSTNLTLGRTLGSGHFHQMEVPDQVNATIDRFMAVNALASASGSPTTPPPGR